LQHTDPGFFVTQTFYFFVFSQKYTFLFHIAFEYEGNPLKEMTKFEKNFDQI